MQNIRGEEGFNWTDSILEGLGAGLTASFLAKIHPGLSHYLILEFLKYIPRRSIVVILGLFVTFGAENSTNGPAVLLTEGIQNLQLDEFLTLFAITHRNVGGLINSTPYSKQLIKNVKKKFDKKRSTDSWTKIRDLRHTLIQYLLHQNCFGSGEDKTIEK